MIRIELPYPDKDLNPNARLHWAKLAKAKNTAREYACVMTMARLQEANVTFKAPVSVAIQFYPPDRRKRDDDNVIASFKAYRDGIADALGIDDNRAVFKAFYVFNLECQNKTVVEVKQL